MASANEDKYNVIESTAAASRNATAIAEVCYEYFSANARFASKTHDVLELACGAGAHAVEVGAKCRDGTRSYRPSDVTSDAFEDIERAIAQRVEEHGGNVREPVVIDMATFEPESESLDGVVAVNAAHVASARAVDGMFRGSAKGLRSGGVLLIYGPFKDEDLVSRDGFRSDGDRAFDAALRVRDAENFGLVSVQRMDAYASAHGLAPVARKEMPANNLTLVYSKP